MKAELQGFKYFLNDKQLKNWDELEKKIEKLNVEIEVNTQLRELHARTKTAV